MGVNMDSKEALGKLFGSYKAEWLREKVFDFFTEPDYFPELTNPAPCVLIGGRGTGKTTVLRCLSYEGQFALRKEGASEVKNWPFYGMYYRVNTNRVTAFRGPELSDEKWVKVFAHYLNLTLCEQVVRFLMWYQFHNSNGETLAEEDCRNIASSLHVEESSSLKELLGSIVSGHLAFEACINNIADGGILPLSLQGAPVDLLLGAIHKLPQFKEKSFFFVLDEYENFLDYQQQVVNTLIKHSGGLYSFKVGVRELGFRCRTTLNENEQLISPSDYIRINIAEKLEGDFFLKFASNVCNARLEKLGAGIEEILPKITEEKEAILLDAKGDHLAAQAGKHLSGLVPSSEKETLESLTLLEKYFIIYWAENSGESVKNCWEDFIASREKWDTRYNNYKHALLYTLRRRKSGIQKYYAGLNVFSQLAAGNIRYFLELVNQSLLIHLQKGEEITTPISIENQTIAAQKIGKKNLSELEGLSVYGAQLTKLLLGLGRVFQLKASNPYGRAPEVTQFHLKEVVSSEDEDNYDEADKLIRSAVMHLALLRFPGSKLTDDSDTRSYDYMVHPIYSAFFCYSYRRKRKMNLSGHELLGLVKDPHNTIKVILGEQEDEGGLIEPLPDQLMLFEGFYDGSS